MGLRGLFSNSFQSSTLRGAIPGSFFSLDWLNAKVDVKSQSLSLFSLKRVLPTDSSGPIKGICGWLTFKEVLELPVMLFELDQTTI